MFPIMFIIKTVAVFFVHIRFKCAVRPDWKCRGCVVMIVMITAALLMLGMHSDDVNCW